MKKSFLKIGHRGYRVGTEENTYDAFDLAVETGLDFIECDLRLTADGEIIVFHDRTFRRICGKRKRVSRTRLKTVKKLRTKGGRPIPIFTDMFRKYIDKIGIMAEIKDPRVKNRLTEILRCSDFNPDNLVLSGSDPVLLSEIKKELDLPIRICYNITHGRCFTLAELLNAKIPNDITPLPDMISLDISKTDVKFISKCRELGINPLCWNLIAVSDPIKEARRVINGGIGGILFDNPRTVNILFRDKNPQFR